MKQELRKEFLNKRNSLSDIDRRYFSKNITSHLLKLNLIKEAQSVHSFISYHSEVDTHKFIQSCLLHRKKVYSPKVVSKTDLIHYQINNLKDCLASIHGILEPNSDNCPLMLESPDVILVPGLAFDLSGNRLGYGGGYYDKFLSQFPNTSKIGVFFSCQQHPSLPTEPHDIQLDLIITEKGLQKL